ncbi:uncharacterized protein LOC118410853 [Branchiostoma floridae]|uniref:Uncharacterized protein LOC118410853 n=1 Tax=Branchiostoma floridae TaxID=7739 RepID=A0A9J7KS83_BRAFL|nr:uncharacterized protein LOC118410853 [Branchiostoma floridae]
MEVHNRYQTALILLLFYVLWLGRGDSAITVQQAEHLKSRIERLKSKVDAVNLKMAQTAGTLNNMAETGLPEMPEFNIAEGKTAFQTSTQGYHTPATGQQYPGDARLAVDGNTNGIHWENSCIHTKGEANPAWWVDLGQSYMIKRVEIYNRMDCCSERLNPFNIHIGSSSTVTSNPKCGGDHQIDVNQPSISVSCQGMTGRYVGVRLPGSRTLTLCEVQVFSTSDVAVQSAPISSNTPAPETCGLSTFIHVPQSDCAGSRIDIAAHGGVTLQFCADACCADPTCLSFQHNAQSTCYLKNKLCSAGEKGYAGGGNMYDRQDVAVQSAPAPAPTPAPGVNVAQGKTAFQTSTSGYWIPVTGEVFSGEAHLAVDGNTNGDHGANSCTHTNGEGNDAWWVDLGRSYVINSVVIFNRMDCCSERLNPFNIHIGDSDQVIANPKCGGDHQIDLSQPSISVSCQGMTGRYVGVRLVGSSRAMSLCEVQVFSNS